MIKDRSHKFRLIIEDETFYSKGLNTPTSINSYLEYFTELVKKKVSISKYTEGIIRRKITN